MLPYINKKDGYTKAASLEKEEVGVEGARAIIGGHESVTDGIGKCSVS